MVVPKIRAWWKSKNKMITVMVIDWVNQVIDGLHPNIEINFSDVILMQSTGLFDKNGTEIFDGDIVKAGEHKDDTYNFKFVNRKFGFHSVDPNGVDYYLGGNTEEEYAALFEGLEVFVVIGNIYENPELLEEVTK